MVYCSACDDTGLQQNIDKNIICSFCMPKEKKNDKPKHYVLVYSKALYNKITNEFVVNKTHTEYKSIDDAQEDRIKVQKKYTIKIKLTAIYK